MAGVAAHAAWGHRAPCGDGPETRVGPACGRDGGREEPGGVPGGDEAVFTVTPRPSRAQECNSPGDLRQTWICGGVTLLWLQKCSLAGVLPVAAVRGGIARGTPHSSTFCSTSKTTISPFFKFTGERLGREVCPLVTVPRCAVRRTGPPAGPRSTRQAWGASASPAMLGAQAHAGASAALDTGLLRTCPKLRKVGQCQAPETLGGERAGDRGPRAPPTVDRSEIRALGSCPSALPTNAFSPPVRGRGGRPTHRWTDRALAAPPRPPAGPSQSGSRRHTSFGSTVSPEITFGSSGGSY